jgi:hypothetical protein
MMYPVRADMSLASFLASDSTPTRPLFSMILAQAYDATMMPIPAPGDNFLQCKFPPRADGLRLWGRIARGAGSGGGIEHATSESEQRT